MMGDVPSHYPDPVIRRRQKSPGQGHPRGDCSGILSNDILSVPAVEAPQILGEDRRGMRRGKPSCKVAGFRAVEALVSRVTDFAV
jgi:hypothetical protein